MFLLYIIVVPCGKSCCCDVVSMQCEEVRSQQDVQLVHEVAAQEGGALTVPGHVAELHLHVVKCTLSVVFSVLGREEALGNVKCCHLQ